MNGMEEEPLVHVVDDDEAMRDSLQWLLEGNGHRVRTHPDAGSFLACVDPSSDGCVLLDVRMPGMDGIETLRRIKALTPATEVILLTGHANMEVALEGMNLGAFDYLLKPVAINDLIFKIQDAAKKSGKTT